MAKHTQLAAQRALQRECAHLRWLEQHFHRLLSWHGAGSAYALSQHSVQQQSLPNKKSAAHATLFPNLYEQLCCSVHLTSSVKLAQV